MNRTNKLRFNLLDLVIFAVVLAFSVYLYYRVNRVLAYNWDWTIVPMYLFRKDDETGGWVANLLLLGLYTTIKLALWSIVFSALIGGLMGILRTSKRLFPRMISRTYVELIRNIPPLVFIFVFFFFIAGMLMPLFGIEEFVKNASPNTLQIIGWLATDPKLLTNFIAGVICLSLFAGAYVTEIVRAGIQSIPKAQYEAGESMGLSKWQIMRYIVLPQALARVIPPLAGQFIILIKDSSLVSLISIQELTFIAMEVANSSGRLFEVWIFVGVLYFVICYGLAKVFGRLEKRSESYR